MDSDDFFLVNFIVFSGDEVNVGLDVRGSGHWPYFTPEA